MVSPEFAYLENWARNLCDQRVLEGRDYRILDDLPSDETATPGTRILLYHDPFEPREDRRSGENKLERGHNQTAILYHRDTGTVTFELDIFPHAREVFELWEYFYSEIHTYFDQNEVDLRIIGRLEDDLKEIGVTLDQTGVNRSLTFYQSRTHTRGTLGERDFGLTLGWQGTFADVAEMFQHIPKDFITGDTEEERWNNFLTYFFTSVLDGVERVYPYVFQYEKHFFEWRSAEIVYEKMRAQTDEERMREPLDLILLGHDIDRTTYYGQLTRMRFDGSDNWLSRHARARYQEGQLSELRFTDMVFYEPEYPGLMVGKMSCVAEGEKQTTTQKENIILWWDDAHEELSILIRPFFKPAILTQWDNFIDGWREYRERLTQAFGGEVFEIYEGLPELGSLEFLQSTVLHTDEDMARGSFPRLCFGVNVVLDAQRLSLLSARNVSLPEYADMVLTKLKQYYVWAKTYLEWYESEIK